MFYGRAPRAPPCLLSKLVPYGNANANLVRPNRLYGIYKYIYIYASERYFCIARSGGWTIGPRCPRPSYVFYFFRFLVDFPFSRRTVDARCVNVSVIILLRRGRCAPGETAGGFSFAKRSAAVVSVAK